MTQIEEYNNHVQSVLRKCINNVAYSAEWIPLLCDDKENEDFLNPDSVLNQKSFYTEVNIINKL